MNSLSISLEHNALYQSAHSAFPFYENCPVFLSILSCICWLSTPGTVITPTLHCLSPSLLASSHINIQITSAARTHVSQHSLQ